MKAYPVRGHMCKGLENHYTTALYGCYPTFGMHGEIRGCDATNFYLINYCPYCGGKLQEASTLACKRKLNDLKEGQQNDNDQYDDVEPFDEVGDSSGKNFSYKKEPVDEQ